MGYVAGKVGWPGWYLTGEGRRTLEKLGEFDFKHCLKPRDFDLQTPKVRLSPFSLPDSSVYHGKWSSGKPHGQGRQIWPDGTLFEGNLV